ncbi:P-loop NTPase fold protein [Nostoc sp.]|uniref:P-loop NTPase fold protein n=1 Tax=Nostoc sp. TaxID=1180 RepID=UPI002FFAB6CB
MSIQLVRNQINKFLNSETPEVLAIRGNWGVGKTFIWNKFIKDAKQGSKIALKPYAYVSLFGCNSLDNLKFTIFEQIIDTDSIGLKPSIETFRKSAESLSNSIGRKSIKFLQGLPNVKNIFLAVETVSFFSINKTIICIDDIERKGDSLKIRDVLGLILLLKEQKDCKIVIILNDESFNKNEDNELNIYREKVIDMEILFKPTPKECAEIAIPSDCFYSSDIKKFSNSLGINNIRVIRKILRLSSQLEPLLNGYEPELVHQALHTMTLFAWCYFQKGNHKVPNYEYLKKIGYKMYGLDDKQETDQEKEWNALLRNYSYKSTDEFDLEIAKAIESGFFNEIALSAEATKLNAKIIANKSEKSFSEAWRKYHDTFNSNEAELIALLYESFK